MIIKYVIITHKAPHFPSPLSPVYRNTDSRDMRGLERSPILLVQGDCHSFLLGSIRLFCLGCSKMIPNSARAAVDPAPLLLFNIHFSLRGRLTIDTSSIINIRNLE